MIDINEIKAGRISNNEKLIKDLLCEKFGSNKLYKLFFHEHYPDSFLVLDEKGKLIIRIYKSLFLIDTDYIYEKWRFDNDGSLPALAHTVKIPELGMEYIVTSMILHEELKIHITPANLLTVNTETPFPELIILTQELL